MSCKYKECPDREECCERPMDVSYKACDAYKNYKDGQESIREAVSEMFEVAYKSLNRVNVKYPDNTEGEFAVGILGVMEKIIKEI